MRSVSGGALSVTSLWRTEIDADVELHVELKRSHGIAVHLRRDHFARASLRRCNPDQTRPRAKIEDALAGDGGRVVEHIARKRQAPGPIMRPVGRAKSVFVLARKAHEAARRARFMQPDLGNAGHGGDRQVHANEGGRIKSAHFLQTMGEFQI